MSKFPSYPFSVAAGQLVRERIWHPSQKIQELAESCIGMIPSTFMRQPSSLPSRCVGTRPRFRTGGTQETGDHPLEGRAGVIL